MSVSTKSAVSELVSLATGCDSCTGCSAQQGDGEQGAMPEIKVIPGIHASHQHGVEYDDADLLIITKMLGADLGPGPLSFDAHHGGLISQAIAEHNFKGNSGEHLTIEIPGQEGSEKKPRHIVVVGLGSPEDVSKRRVCALFNYALDLSCHLKAESLILPVFPYRLTADTLGLKATGAILRCLVAERARRHAVGNLKEIRLLCAPQAKTHLAAGLAVEHSLCNHCRIPKMTEKPRY